MTSSYTIKSGDNLWNICKRQFKLSSNAEIAKKVDEVAKANNIKKPSLIFAGETIKLGAMDTIEKTTQEPIKTKEETTQTQTTTPIAPEITKAVNDKIKLNDIKSVEDLDKLQNSSVSIFSSGTKTDEQKQQAYTQYSEKLLKEYYDINGDGIVTKEEFAQREEEDNLKLGKLTDTTDEKTKTSFNRTANLFANHLDINNDGVISAKEFAFFQRTSDSQDENHLEDGIISARGENIMYNAFTGHPQTETGKNELLERYYNNEEMSESDLNQAVIAKYLEGRKMTEKEMEILQKADIKIRNGLKKAAGLDD